MARRRCLILAGGLAVALAGSLALNGVLYGQARGFYRELRGQRLDPLGLSHYGPAPEEGAGDGTLVVLFGDSRAADWPAPDVEGFRFANRGIHGETSAQARGRFAAHVAPLRPDVVVVQVGVNDLTSIGVLPGRRDALVANCIANIAGIVERGAALGAGVVVTTIFPVGPVPPAQRLFWPDEVPAAVEEVNAALRAMEGGHGGAVSVLDAYALLVGEGGRTRPVYSADLLHLTAAGYARLNEALAAHLAGLGR